MWLLRRTCFKLNHLTTLWDLELALPLAKSKANHTMSEQLYLCGLWLFFKTLMITLPIPSIVFTDVLALLCFGPSLVTANSFSTSWTCSLTNACGEKWHRIARCAVAMTKMWVMTKTERCCECQQCKMWTFDAFYFTSNQLINKNPERRKFPAWFVGVQIPWKRWLG